MPLPPVYDYILGACIIVPIALIFFASGFLYNKLCNSKLLAADENRVTEPVKRTTHLILLGVGVGIAFVFYYLLTHDALELTLILFLPPAVVAVLCELKNGFIPPVSLFIGGCAVFVRILYYSLTSGFAYGLSIIVSLIIAFALLYVPRFLSKKLRAEATDVTQILFFALTASFFAPLYVCIFVFAVFLLRLLIFLAADLIRKKMGRPSFSVFPVPLQLTASAVFLGMLFI